MTKEEILKKYSIQYGGIEYIDKEHALRAMQKYADQEVQSQLTDLTNKLKEREWISVKNKLPDNEQQCVIWSEVEKKAIYDAWYYPEDEEWWSSNLIRYGITHWMQHPTLTPPSHKTKEIEG
jgi:hypothetical protein